MERTIETLRAFEHLAGTFLDVGRAPARHPDESAPRLEPTGMSARDVRAMLHDPEFQAIVDRNSQLIFLQKYAIDECNLSMNDKKLATIYQISEGHSRWIRCIARKREEYSSQAIGRSHKLPDDHEREVMEMILTAANDLNFPARHELLDEIENRYHKVLTYGWIHEFLRRHQDEITYLTVRPHEDPRLQIPRQFLEQYLALVHEHALGSIHDLFTILMRQDALIRKSEVRIMG